MLRFVFLTSATFFAEGDEYTGGMKAMLRSESGRMA